jgi:hypothetical protein
MKFKILYLLKILKYKELAKKIILSKMRLFHKSPNRLSLDFKLLRSFVACSKFLRCSYFRL